MKKVVFILCLSISHLQHAQDRIVYQFPASSMYYNCAMPGFRNKAEINTVYNRIGATFGRDSITDLYSRAPFLSFTAGLPFVINKSADHPITIGCSIGYTNSSWSVESQQAFRIGSNVSLPISEKSELRIGVEFMRQIRSISSTGVIINGKLMGGPESDTKNGINAGIVFSRPSWKQFYAGFSITHLTKERFEFSPVAMRYNSQRYLTPTEYYLLAGVSLNNIFHIQNLDVNPALLVRAYSYYSHVAISRWGSSFQMNMVYKKIIELGGMYTDFYGTTRRIGALIAFYPLAPLSIGEKNSLRLGYSLMPHPANSLISPGLYIHEGCITFTHKMK
jgi:hypothetical protein